MHVEMVMYYAADYFDAVDEDDDGVELENSDRMGMGI